VQHFGSGAECERQMEADGRGIDGDIERRRIQAQLVGATRGRSRSRKEARPVGRPIRIQRIEHIDEGVQLDGRRFRRTGIRLGEQHDPDQQRRHVAPGSIARAKSCCSTFRRELRKL
jgi:hypothetical protein